MTFIYLFVAAIVLLGIVLDRVYSKIPPDQSTVRIPADPLITENVYTISGYERCENQVYFKRLTIEEFGQFYNHRFRHIKKYKRNGKK